MTPRPLSRFRLVHQSLRCVRASVKIRDLCTSAVQNFTREKPLRWNNGTTSASFSPSRANGACQRAARALGVDHATVGRRLSAFERRLSAKLFNRTPEGFAITAAGQAILNQAEGMEASALAVERLATGHDTQIERTGAIDDARDARASGHSAGALDAPAESSSTPGRFAGGPAHARHRATPSRYRGANRAARRLKSDLSQARRIWSDGLCLSALPCGSRPAQTRRGPARSFCYLLSGRTAVPWRSVSRRIARRRPRRDAYDGHCLCADQGSRRRNRDRRIALLPRRRQSRNRAPMAATNGRRCARCGWSCIKICDARQKSGWSRVRSLKLSSASRRYFATAGSVTVESYRNCRCRTSHNRSSCSCRRFRCRFEKYRGS